MTKSRNIKKAAALLIFTVFMLGAASVGVYAAVPENITIEEPENIIDNSDDAIVYENQDLSEADANVQDPVSEENETDAEASAYSDDAIPVTEDGTESADIDPAENSEEVNDVEADWAAEEDAEFDEASNEDYTKASEDDYYHESDDDDTATDFILVTDGISNSYGPDSIVGNLSIIARYTEGESIFSGHSYVLFTSFLDNLTLSFEDLYGYYTFDEDFKNTADDDTDALSWRYDFDRLAADLYPDLTLEEYTSLSMDEREKNYPDLYNALVSIADNQCFILHLGTEQEDSRYRVVAYDYELNTGDYLTIGNYNMSGSTVKSAIDAVLNSTMSQKLKDLIQENTNDGATTNQIISDVSALYTSYVNGQITKDQLLPSISSYLENAINASGYQEVINNYLDEFDITEFIDGNTTGGLLVNRELNRQKAGWDQSPNRVYSIDITGRQLDDMMAYVNSGINYFNACFHNCSSVSSGISNAVIGYVRDENGNNTDEESALYIDPSDTTYSWTLGLINSPKQVYETIDSWADDTSDGVKDEWTIVHGVAVPDDDCNTDSVPCSTADPIPYSSTATDSAFHASVTDSASYSTIESPQTGDDTHLPELACLMIASGLGILWMRRLKKGKQSNSCCQNTI